MLLNETTIYILILAALAFSLIAQVGVKNKFKKYAEVRIRSGITGGEAAKQILEMNDIYDVSIQRVDGSLTDHYDPMNRVLRLSSDTMNSASIAAVGVAAHEAGHAIQHKEMYAPLSIRTACVKTAGIGSQAAWPIFVLGLILSWEPLLYAGICLYAAMVLFTLVTLPVEFNASSRAVRALTDSGILASDETHGARKVLSAAAMTYVASALMAVLQLLRLMAIAGRRRD